MKARNQNKEGDCVHTIYVPYPIKLFLDQDEEMQNF